MTDTTIVRPFGDANNFPPYMQKGVKYCPHGHARYPTSPETVAPKCGRCRAAGFVDHEGRKTRKGRAHLKEMTRHPNNEEEN